MKAQGILDCFDARDEACRFLFKHGLRFAAEATDNNGCSAINDYYTMLRLVRATHYRRKFGLIVPGRLAITVKLYTCELAPVSRHDVLAQENSCRVDRDIL